MNKQRLIGHSSGNILINYLTTVKEMDFTHLSQAITSAASILQNIFKPNTKKAMFMLKSIPDDFTTAPPSQNTQFLDYFCKLLDYGINKAKIDIDAGKPHNAILKLQATVKLLLLLQYLLQKSYLKPLMLKANQLAYRDEYGDLCLEAVENEISSFVEKRIKDIHDNTDLLVRIRYSHYISKPSLENNLFFGPITSEHLYHTADRYSEIIFALLISIESFTSSSQATNKKVKNYTSPIDYERYVAEILRSELNWNTKTTKGSGDQGADIIATKNGISLVIQCKLYNSTVGNKAIQEAHAAKAFYSSNYAAVITNSSFSLSAKQLAASVGVHILHHSQLKDLDKEIFGARECPDEEMPVISLPALDTYNHFAALDEFFNARDTHYQTNDTNENYNFLVFLDEFLRGIGQAVLFLGKGCLQLMILFISLMALMMRRR